MTTPNQLPAWTPGVCTLPTERRPLRLAEFDDLFSGVASLDRLSPVQVRMRLVGATGLEGMHAISRALTELNAARCGSLTNCTCADCPMPFAELAGPERFGQAGVWK